MRGDGMKKNVWRYLWLIVIAEGAGALSGFLSREGMRAYSLVPQSRLTPPDWVFPVVWIVLYLLMAAAVGLVLSGESPGRRTVATLFFLQLGVNFCWSPIFFNLRAYGFAFLWLILLWALAALLMRGAWQADRRAGWMLAPYLVWLTFAGYLNCVTWLLNR